MISYDLDWLNRWYTKNQQKSSTARGVEVDTLPDGSWKLTVPLEGGAISVRAFSPVKVRRTKTDWFDCRIEGQKFQATAGPRNLPEALSVFRKWSEEKQLDADNAA